MRCASLHRKLGTHISKVKSLSMDSWSNDQVDVNSSPARRRCPSLMVVQMMKRNGNANSNRTYNPRNTKPSIPLDVDEVDAALERFIRQKYDQQLFSGGGNQTKRHDTGSTRSSDDLPPPLPPKPIKRFGFGLRSASATVTASKPTQDSPPRSPEARDRYRSPPSPIRLNKQSRVFGASVGSSGENLESKLTTLKDMGFPDEKRNSNILKGLGGNLERTIESLVRLGEGSTPDSWTRTPVQNSKIFPSQPLASSAEQSGPVSTAATRPNGLMHAEPNGQAGYSNPQAITAPPNQSTQRFSSSNPFQSQPPNPFENAPETQRAVAPLEKVFDQMQISQPLFPNATGGYPAQHQQTQEARLHQSMTPPVPQLPHQQSQANPYSHPSYLPGSHYNPFSSALHASSTPTSPYLGYQQTFKQAYNPFTGLSSNGDSSGGSQITNGFASGGTEIYPASQRQQQPYNQAPQPVLSSNPFMTQQQSSSSFPHYTSLPRPPPPQVGERPPLHFIQPQRTGRIDKSSILALYNYPHMAPSPPPGPSDGTPNNPSSFIPLSTKTSPTHAEGIPTKAAQRSVTMPMNLSSGSRNPFQQHSSNSAGPHVGSPLAQGPSMSRHISQDSVDIGGAQNGRHSPDAFASLSARIVR